MSMWKQVIIDVGELQSLKENARVWESLISE